ncbi:MAG TPA: acetolactate synthase large subunit [Polyangiales bacterium]|nr:acetolactate synthase large subunit [Polyangiales bacterium]
MKASDLLVKALEHEGVRYVFGLPGEENLDVLESLRASSIRLIVTRHEQGAGFMAATHGRLTGCTGVALSTLGPGATNLLTPAAYAQLGAMPMLMLTGQKPIKASKQALFQIVDVVEMMRPVTKYTQQIVNGSAIPSRVRQAFRVAQQERPGAVHLELPEDIAREDCPDPFLFPIEKTRRPAADSKAVASGVAVIERARRPLILIGAGANRTMTSHMLQRFVDRTGIPFFTTQMGKGVLDERQELFLGTAALSEHDYLHQAVDAADLIINVGHDVVEKPPFFMTRDGAEVLHVNYSPAEVDPVYFPQYEIIGDVANAVWQIGETIHKQQHWESKCFLDVKRALMDEMTAQSDADAFPIKPQRLVRDMRAGVPEDGIIALDNGMYKIWFARNYPAYQPNTVLLDNALASMGAGLPSAMCAALLFPKRKVVAVCGDGGFLMNSQELETAVRIGLNLVVVILRDDGYGMIQWKQDAMGLESYGLKFNNPDFVKYAEAYGATGVRITKARELLPALRSALDAGGIHLLDVPIDYSENRIFTRELERVAAESPSLKATKNGG